MHLKAYETDEPQRLQGYSTMNGTGVHWIIGSGFIGFIPMGEPERAFANGLIYTDREVLIGENGAPILQRSVVRDGRLHSQDTPLATLVDRIEQDQYRHVSIRTADDTPAVVFSTDQPKGDVTNEIRFRYGLFLPGEEVIPLLQQARGVTRHLNHSLSMGYCAKGRGHHLHFDSVGDQVAVRVDSYVNELPPRELLYRPTQQFVMEALSNR